MACFCANNWATTRLAQDRGWGWHNASLQDAEVVSAFLASGGTGNVSIDKFVREELLSSAQLRFANSFLLLD
jgi:hypothetical protein